MQLICTLHPYYVMIRRPSMPSFVAMMSLLLGLLVGPSEAAFDVSGNNNIISDNLASLQMQASSFNAANLLPRLLSRFVRVLPTSCSTGIGSYDTGMCHSHEECAEKGGTSTSMCAVGFGTCCVVRHSCGHTSDSACHYFTNPSYPMADTSVNGGTCSLTIQPCDEDICQVRLDYIDVDLSQPDAVTGACNVDNVVITGNGASPAKIPSLCGKLNGQHTYITVEPTCNPTNIHVDMNAANSNGRKFNIKVTKIPCNSPELAPPGCLKYYDSTSGTISTYNNVHGGLSRLIAGQNYATCIAAQPGYCSITWKLNNNNNFDIPSKCDAANCICCKSSYVLIPGATCPGMAFADSCNINDQRFCGDSFLTGGTKEVMSWHQPFTLFTYIPQPLDKSYSGYTLDYTLNRCT